MLRIYVDTDIFLNLWFNEMIRYNPVFERAKRLLERVISCRLFLIISELTLEELSRNMRLSIDTIKSDYFNEYANLGKLSVAEVTQDIVNEARRLSHHVGDATHAVIAKREGAVLITRNKRHFLPIARKLRLRIVVPEQVI